MMHPRLFFSENTVLLGCEIQHGKGVRPEVKGIRGVSEDRVHTGDDGATQEESGAVIL